MIVQNWHRLGIPARAAAISAAVVFAEKGYDAQMSDFVEAIRTGRPAATSVEDGARATVACLRLMESCRDGGNPKQIDWRSVTGS